MAIADAEPKKGNVGTTSTASSSSSRNCFSVSSETQNVKNLPSLEGPVKYSSLKEFSFSVPDVWNDYNISIFLDSCHMYIDDLKLRNSLEDNKVWEKIAKSGLEKSGSVECFNVNYCLELASALKLFVSKNENKMMDNQIFKQLFDKVVDLLPYFAPLSPVRPRSRSKSTENSKHDKNGIMLNGREDLIIPPFGTASESKQVLRLIAGSLKKHKVEDLTSIASRAMIWKEASSVVEKEMGVPVNPRAFLEGYKRSVIVNVRKIIDPKERSREFLEQFDELLPYFDILAPRSTKKADFLIFPENNPVEKVALTSKSEESKKRKNKSVDPPDDKDSEPAPKILRSHGPLEDDGSDASSSLVANTSHPSPRTYSKKKPDVETPKLRTPTKKPKDKENSEVASVVLPEMEVTPSQADSGEVCMVSPDSGVSIGSMAPPSVEKSRKGSLRKTKSSTPVRKVLPKRQARQEEQRSGTPVVELRERPRRGARSISEGSETKASPSTEVPPVSRNLPSASKSCSETAVSKYRNPKNSTLFERPLSLRSPATDLDNDDSEIEDVPLIGTNIRVHTANGSEKSGVCSSVENMNPIVLLDKMPAESLFETSASKRRVKSYRGKKTDNELPGPSRSGSSFSSTKALQTRDKLRPKTPVGRPKIQTSKARSALVSRSNSLVVSQMPLTLVGPNSPVVQASMSRGGTSQMERYVSKDLTVPSSSRELIPASSLVSPDELVSRPNIQVNPPEWFERFVIETRRHEMWKVHQLMKMQQELLDAECKKRGVLEKILTVLNDGV